jgi:hypothetical protein
MLASESPVVGTHSVRFHNTAPVFCVFPVVTTLNNSHFLVQRSQFCFLKHTLFSMRYELDL